VKKKPLYPHGPGLTETLASMQVLCTRQNLVETAQAVYDTTAGATSDGDVLAKVVEELKAKAPSIAFASSRTLKAFGVMVALTQSGDGQTQILSQHNWADSGFPVLTMGHRYAAALLCTNASKEVIDSAKPPWPGYLIEVPDGLISMAHPSTGEALDICRILVCKCHSPRVADGWLWAYHAMTLNGFTLFRYGVTSAELLPPNIDDMELSGGRTRRDPDFSPFAQYDLVGRDERACALIGRLIVNSALAMSSPTRPEAPPKRVRHRINSPFSGRHEPEPTCRTYVLGKNIEIKADLRDAVRAYVDGKQHRAPSVQTLVAGHYKMQPYGPRNALRKLIWREPFWRGPEDGPIAVRDHVLSEEGEPS
jgi:hypothetical protein